MNSKFLWFAGILVVVVLAAVGVFAVYNNKTQKQTATPVKKADTMKPGDKATPPAASAKKGMKQFTLKAVGNSGVAGDGSITLKADLTSLAARLTSAPALASGEKYEVYVVPAGSAVPIYAGEMFALNSKTEKFLWGGAGKVEWYTAAKIVVSKRAASETKPGKAVAEGILPAEGQPAQ